MNDPHVKALVYIVRHSPAFIYEKAPYHSDLPEFRIKIEWSQATVEPKDHFATAEEARAAIEPLLRAWEFDAALKHDNPDVLRFAYLAPDIIDRNPTPEQRRYVTTLYSIDRDVIDSLGDLAARKGGPHARKFKGYAAPAIALGNASQTESQLSCHAS